LFDVGVDPHVTRADDEDKLAQLARILNLPDAVVFAAFRRKVETTEDGQATRPVRWTRLAEAVDERTYERALARRAKISPWWISRSIRLSARWPEA
jgi:hypothetical protein